ncbi:hypothetical protein DFS34DRAFT_30514 [Phlyctochytrium arcticum]|nr:hypothetical protein DFS34DRAFT_30514 [Phlyctochytrium arcticum]
MNETTTYLKTQVEEKTKELNDIRSKALKPKDLDIIKFRTIQDMEEQNEKRWKGLQKEMEKFRSAYYALRRDHEVAKADIDRERATMEAKAREMEAVYQEETAALEARTLELRQCLDTSTDIKRHREIQRELADLQIKMQTMQPEIDELRAEREKLRVDIEQQARVHQRKLMDEVSHSKLLQAEKESLLSRITSLETEDTQNLRKLDQMSEQNTILTKELDKTKSRLEEATHKFNTAMSDQKLEGLKYKNEYENIISDLKDKKAEIESRLKQAEEVIGNLRERVAHGEKDLLEKLRIAREEEWAKRAQIESEKCELEKQLAASKQKVTEDETWNDTARKELQNELAQLKQTVRILQTQKDGLAQKEQENTIMIDRMNVDLTQLRSSLLEAESIGKDAMKDVELHKKAEEVLRYQHWKLPSQMYKQS